MRRRLYTRRRSGNPVKTRPHIWAHNESFNGTFGLTTTTTFVIVNAGDFAVRAGPERAVVLRIRGYINLWPDAANSLGYCSYYIVRQESSASSGVANASATYDTKRIIWTGGSIVSRGGTAEIYQAVKEVIDVKAKVTVQEDQELSLVITNPNSFGLRSNMLVRALTVIKA